MGTCSSHKEKLQGQSGWEDYAGGGPAEEEEGNLEIPGTTHLKEMENYLQAGNAGAGRGFLYPPPFGDEGAASLGLALAGFDSTGGRVTPLSADHDSLLLGGCANLKTSEDFQASPPRKAVIHRLGSFLSPSSPLDLGDSSPQASPLKKSKMLGAPIQESVACLAS